MIIETGGWRSALLSKLGNRTGASVRLAGDGLAVLFALGTGSACSFLVQVMLARVMGPEQFGVYALVMSWVMTLSLFLSFGLDSTILRFVAAYRSLAHFGALRGLLRRTTQIVVAGSLIAAATMALISIFLGPGVSAAFLAGALLLPILTLLQFGNKILVSLHHPVCAVLSGQMARHCILAGVILVLAYGVRFPLNAQRAILLVSFAVLVALLANQYYTSRFLPKDVSRVPAEYRTREWLGVGLPLLVVTAAEQILSRGDIIMLGFFRSKTEVGIYGAAVALTMCMDMVISSLNSVIAPRFAELHARHNRDGLQRLLTRSSMIVVLAVLHVALILILFGPQILRLFGKGFVSGSGALALLAIGYLIRALTGSVGLILSMTGMQSLYARTVVVTACINLGFDLVLIPRYGIIGAAAATVCGVALRSIALGVIAALKGGTMPTAVAPMLLRLRGTSPVPVMREVD